MVNDATHQSGYTYSLKDMTNDNCDHGTRVAYKYLIPGEYKWVLTPEDGSYNVAEEVDFVIKPNEEIILNNQKIGNKRPCEYYLWQQTNMNSKKNPLIGDLSKELLMAIEQEKYLNQDKGMCLEKISSNIGQILEKIIRDER